MTVKTDLVVGFTCSAFDLLHPGHILMLSEAKTVCDYLICGLHVDPGVERAYKSRPVQSVLERFIQLKAVKYVDEIVPYETERDLENILWSYPIDVRIIGSEYKDKPFTGRAICEDLGIKLHYNSRRHSYSTSKLRQVLLSAKENDSKDAN